jgi:phosphoribosylanthranilate isomerase
MEGTWECSLSASAHIVKIQKHSFQIELHIMRFKICCIQNPEELNLAVSAGANAIGLVGRMPSGPGPIDDDMIRSLAADVPPGVSSFLLTSETDPMAIIDHHHKTCTDTLQLVDYISEDGYAMIKAYLPSVRIVQVIHVTGKEVVDMALRCAEHVDALLLDSGNPNSAIKTLGGTGNVHDWSISRRIVAESPKPVFLAGGLNAANVREAINVVQPYGVDICSGVRQDGKLNAVKLEAFVNAVMQ